MLADADRHHLERARRLRPGDRLTVGDGRGRHRSARFGGDLSVEGPVVAEPKPEPPLTVAFGLTKGDRPDLTVQKLTEIGIDRIVPFVADRTVVRWDEHKAARNVGRWRAIAREAAAQAHRAWLPEVTEVGTFASAIASPGAALTDPTGEPPTAERTTWLVGPEGGWSPDEVALAAHLPRVRIAGHVLRAETAAIVSGALLAALRGVDGPPLVRPT